jgi:hypothetical protein
MPPTVADGRLPRMLETPLERGPHRGPWYERSRVDTPTAISEAFERAASGRAPILEFVSQRKAQGRLFEPRQEAALLPDVEHLARGFSKPDHLTILVRELVVPFGVVDLAALVVGAGALLARVRLGVPPILNELDAAIVAALGARRPNKIPTVARRLGWTVDTVLRRLPALRRSGAVRQVGRGSLLRADGLEPLGELVALEAKVRDWRGALHQAKTYGLWCDRAVGVLSEPVSSWDEVADAFRSARVGLALRREWAVKPVRRHLPAYRRLLGSEAFLAGLLGKLEPLGRRVGIETDAQRSKPLVGTSGKRGVLSDRHEGGVGGVVQLPESADAVRRSLVRRDLRHQLAEALQMRLPAGRQVGR